jgi:stearoyl-CoA 9-desaturase NADPH oxidoreductase
MMLTTKIAPAATRFRGGLHTLAELAATPLAPTDYLDLLDPLRSRTDLRARIVSVVPETAGASTVTLRPGKTWRRHRPGQFVRVGVEVDGVRHWRSYSLTSPSDRADGLLSVTVQTIPDGLVSNHLVRQAQPGELVHLDQAAGEFTLPATLPTKTLFVTAGSGITPVMGMLRSHLDDLSDVVVVHSAPTAQATIFGAELQAMADSGRLRLVQRHTRRDGRLDPAQLAELVPDLAERETWACGPGELLDALEDHWTGEGRGERLHTERFRASLAEPGQGGTIAFRRTGRSVEADGATSLLDAGEDAGVLMPSGCRMGICFGCVVPLRDGAVRDLRTGDVTVVGPDDEVPIQTCINAAATACELDL